MSKSIHAVFSNRTDDWYTPTSIYDYLGRVYGVSMNEWFDPCPLGALERGFDGLEVDWSFENNNIYINPPYSNIRGFVQKAIQVHAHDTSSRIIFLIPARTDTQYYRLLFEYGCEFTFIEGRLKFGGSKNGATFPSVLVKLEGGGINTIKYLHKNKLEEI